MLLLDELHRFLGLRDLMAAYDVQGWKAFTGLDGLLRLAGPVVPLCLLAEALWLALRARWRRARLHVPLMCHAANVLLGQWLVLDAWSWATRAQDLVPFQVPVGVPGFLYAYLVWELAQFTWHYACHKVRLLWCVHAAHHAVDHMNLSLAYTGFYLQALVATTVRVGMCVALGVPMPLLAVVMVVDGVWGGLVHVSEEVLPDGRLGPLARWLMTPQHHRIHHACNAPYLDANFCNLLPLWDRVFGTYRAPVPGVPPVYGLTHPVDASSFTQVYLGEFARLWRDLRAAPGWRTRLALLVMPPGWAPAELTRALPRSA
jgi:sterol desaturase/sphingolipid hydroxylase (fatty acid hydroxylase superfamily)